MPLTGSPEFNPRWDLHILRGQGPVRLGQLLRLWWDRTPEEGFGSTLDDYEAHHHDVVMDFRPVANFTLTGNRYTGFGIELNRRTGELVANAWPAENDAPANFIVEVRVENNGTGVPAAQLKAALLRVHVHRRVNHIWITPPTLSVPRPEGDGVRWTSYAFTVRASFDDGIGDITCSDQLEMLPAEHFRRGDSRVQHILILETEQPGNIAAITARVSAAWGGQQATGIIEITQPWDDSNVPAIEWIDGNPQIWDGTVLPEDAPHVLFVSGGFSNDEANAFRQTTELLVDKLKTQQQFQPFGYLSRSINYWRMFVPNQASGVSVRNEVYGFVRNGQWYALPLPSAERPPDSGRWELKHLLYMAGMPTRADLKLVRDRVTNQPLGSVDVLSERSPSQLDYTRLVQKWNATMAPTPARDVTENTAKDWLSLAARTFIDEVNTYPGTSIGLPPQVAEEDTGILEFHPLRGGRADFSHDILRRALGAPRGNTPPLTLRDPAASNLGSLWRDPEPLTRYAFDNSDLVVALNNATDGRARAGSDIQIRLYLQWPSQDGPMYGIPVVPDAMRDALRLAPLPPTRMIRPDTWRVFAHELGHGLGLGDEYVEDAETFAGPESSFDSYGNLCSTASFINSNGEVRIRDIKWNWDRIRFASVIVGLSRIGTGRRFEIHVKPQPVPWFLPNDIVLFRRRERRRVINRAPPTNLPYIVETVSSDGATITVAPREPTGDLSGMTAGGIIYKPVPHASPNLRLRLVSPAAERIMQIAIKGTMTGVACSMTREQKRGGDTQVPVEDDPVGHVSSKNLSGLVGAYFGGLNLHAGSFIRPASA